MSKSDIIIYESLYTEVGKEGRAFFPSCKGSMSRNLQEQLLYLSLRPQTRFNEVKVMI